MGTAEGCMVWDIWHSSVPPLDASSETPYSERDEEFSNTIAEPVPGAAGGSLAEGICYPAGLGAGESAAETARAGLGETSPLSAERSEGSERDFERPEDPASGVQDMDSLSGLSMPDDDDEAPDGDVATHLAPLAADSLEDLLRSDSRDRRSSEGPHGEALGRTAETEEAADVLMAERTEEGVASLEAAADNGEGMQLSDSSRSGQRLGGEEAAESDSGSLEEEREDAGLRLPASEYATGKDAESYDSPLPAALEGAAEMDGKDEDMPRSISDRRAELQAEELSTSVSAAADVADIWSEEDMLPLSAAAGMGGIDDEEVEDDSFVNF
ncbi:MAG: hypothetical protein MMC33_010720 [Icmadophila ericetorum]|nr:hypothetical protein [Icmadophila ericetorum]